jgi:hypothetical protein
MLSQLAANPNTKENTEAVVVASKEVGLEVNPDKTRYKSMSCRGPNHKTKMTNKSYERLMKFKLELNQQIKSNQSGRKSITRSFTICTHYTSQ